MRRVPYGFKQFTKAADFEKFGLFAMEGQHEVIAALVGGNKNWANFFVAKDNQTRVEITFGQMVSDGELYSQPYIQQEGMDFATKLPLGGNKYATLVAYTVDDNVGAREYRSFYNDQTGQKRDEETTVERFNELKVDWLYGQVGVTPELPEVAPHLLSICHVLLSPAGIESVSMVEGTRLLNLQTARALHDDYLTFKTETGAQLVTLRTDMSAIRQSIPKVNDSSVWQMQRDVSHIKRALGFTSQESMFDVDDFLTEDKTDSANVSAYYRIDEGLRFPFEAKNTQALQLANPNDPAVTTIGGWTMAKHTTRTLIEVFGKYIAVPLANSQYQQTSGEIYPGQKRRRRWGADLVISQGDALWQDYEYNSNYLTKTFKAAGDSFAILDTWVEGGVKMVRVRQYWDDAIKYWNGFKNLTYTVDGFCLAQTWLQSQSAMVNKIELFPKRIDPSVPITVMVGVCKDGQPNAAEIIASCTVQGANMRTEQWNAFNFTPFFLPAATRCFFLVSSASDYHLYARNDNVLTQGTLFSSADGASWVADPGKDLNFRLSACEFTNVRAEIELNSLILAGGMTNVDILTDEVSPDGTDAYFEIKKQGSAKWERLEPTPTGVNHPLVSKPDTVKLRAVMVGTRDLMPLLKLSSSVAEIARTDQTLTHFSTDIDPGFTPDDIEAEMRIDNFNPAKHTITMTILSGGQTNVADVTTDTVASDGSTVRRMSFLGLTTPGADYVRKIVATSNTDVDLPSIRYVQTLPDA